MFDIFTYTDSRQFLREYYEARKKEQPSFSYQYFANAAGLKSKTYLYRVVTGQKTLSKNAVLAIAQAMRLTKRETEYFEAMVNFSQAKNVREQEFYFTRMQSFGKNNVANRLRQDQFDYLSKWYLPVLREVVGYLDFKEDFNQIARTLDPPITATQAKNGVALLLDLGLIQRSPSGRYSQTTTSLTTGDALWSLAVQNFQKENMRLATESLDRHERSRRDISTLTVGVTEAGFRRICEEAAQFRRLVLEIAGKEESVDRVYQVNIQMFPLTV